MSSARDDERALARIEQGLASDDPALAQRIDVLNRQFIDPTGDGRLTGHRDEAPVTRHTDEEEDPGPAVDDAGKRSLAVKIAVVLAVVAAVGLLLTAILSAPSGSERESPQRYGLDPPASAHVLPDRPGSGMPQGI